MGVQSHSFFHLGIFFSNPISEAESKTLFSVDERKLDKYNSQNTHWNILCIPCVQHCRIGVSVPCLPDFFGGEVIRSKRLIADLELIDFVARNKSVFSCQEKEIGAGLWKLFMWLPD